MYYWPEETGNAPYVSDLAEHLAATGHAVTVLAGRPHYPQWRIADSYRDLGRLEESHAGVRIVRRRHLVPRRQSAVRRLAYEASFVLDAGLFRPRPLPDAVIGVVPSLGGGLLARILAARARAAYGVIIQDLVGAAARQSGIAGGSTAAGLARRAELWIMARATVVAPVTDAFNGYLSQLGVAADRIEVLPNWSRMRSPSGDRRSARQNLGWNDGEMVVLHAGNMGLKQGLEQIVEAARLADARQLPVRFVLMGDGNQRGALERLAQGLGTLDIRDFVDSAALPEVLHAADVLLVSERPTVRDMSLPSKLTSYFVAGRPVIAAVDPTGATAREIARAGAGRAVPAGQPSALLDALLELRGQPDTAEAWAASAHRYAETALNRDVILGRASGMVDRIVQRTIAIRGAGEI